MLQELCTQSNVCNQKVAKLSKAKSRVMISSCFVTIVYQCHNSCASNPKRAMYPSGSRHMLVVNVSNRDGSE